MSAITSLQPAELRRRLDAGADFLLLDVREPSEWELCRIEGSVLIPLGELAPRQSEIDSKRAVVCICHHGVRSSQAAVALARLGFETVYNLAGGIDRWALEVDSSMRRY